MQYFVNEDGNLIVYVPELENDYWRHVSLDEYENTMEFVADEIDEDNIYYVELKPTITDGSAIGIII